MALHTVSVSVDAPNLGRARVLFVLKTRGPQTATKMAKRLNVTPMAVRQHLAVLEGEQLVDFTDERPTVGRPARLWRLTPKALAKFPDSHAEFAVELLQAVQTTFGEQGLDQLLDERVRQQVETYRARMPGPGAPLEKRVAALARIRSEEGHMAEWARQRDGAIRVTERHCSIAKAARVTPKLCYGCLSLFRGVLGEDVSVKLAENILSGDECCSVLVRPRTISN
jgi:predicted ArsR family transcriptional regulator